ncbi:MAG: tRNA (N(6)-L-threonylcarbamoyladenosine(37)-C(2))-methylthiotransferase MtaB [Clostridiales bacterium]|jgi:threonylcarbamoyladenosine tRNA methylthiotransferase MtaB|nr:tRNA (N(6)-L-threonylcarbamoyladenosine(37)-C(2))-methylthiotransferase MtaB [Clostridiales bacterium]
MLISLVNLGCKVNQYELQAIKTSLAAKGHTVSENLMHADVYILNTCAVTGEAERKSRQFVTKALKCNPNAKIAAIGCAAELHAAQFIEKGAHYTGGSFGKSTVSDIIDGLYNDENDNVNCAKNGGVKQLESMPISNAKNGGTALRKGSGKSENGNADFEENGGIEPRKTTHIINAEGGRIAENKSNDKKDKNEYEKMNFASTDRSRQFIKIQDGCNNFCSYCIIPYLRGSSRSRPENDIIEEIERVSLKEIVLIGINLSAYGADTGTSTARLVRRIASVRGDLRIRLGSIEANLVDEEFLSALAAAEKFCPHFHLSLQSGDDGVLKAMNRRYNTEFFKSRVGLIGKYFPDAAITTDIIVGYPTEDGKAFENTLKFVENIGFSDIHIFPYSARTGTRAAQIKCAVPPGEINDRARRLTELKRVLKERYIDAFVNKPLNVLIENARGGEVSGYSENYIRVYADAKCGARIGGICRVTMTARYKDGAKGIVENV